MVGSDCHMRIMAVQDRTLSNLRKEGVPLSFVHLLEIWGGLSLGDMIWIARQSNCVLFCFFLMGPVQDWN